MQPTADLGNLAFLEAKSAIATIARDFELELDPDAGEVRERFAFMVIPEGLRVRLRARTPIAAAPG